LRGLKASLLRPAVKPSFQTPLIPAAWSTRNGLAMQARLCDIGVAQTG
jgi:hypothetical protein